jgi:histidine triad (HIT) family protein
VPVDGEPVPDCPFCKIASGDLDAHVVMDEPDVLAFLDHRPLFPGHTLLIPRKHYATLSDLPEELVGLFFGAGRRVAAAVQEAMSAQGAFVALNNVVSQSVPHIHLHVVPRTRGDGLRGFFWPRQKYGGDQQMADAADAIRRALAAAGA